MPKKIVDQSVDDKLQQLFYSMFDLHDCFSKDQSLKDEFLMGRKFGLAPRDLLCLFFAVEKKFEITIPQEAIVSNRFNTYNNILGIVSELI